MSSSCSYINTLEELPDEILLLICRYLSSTSVLFSFYGLNSRLSQTISGYCRHVVLAQVPFIQFNYICTSILPIIGANICSLVVSNEWTGVLSKIFLNQFGDRMSLIFPCLKHLTLTGFIVKSLTLFLDSLQNLTDLFEIVIHGLFIESNNTNELQNVVCQLLAANNNRLNSIIFDSYSAPFPVDIKDNNVSFSNIEKLHINLKTINDLHRILTVLPRLRCLHVQIHEELFELDEQNQSITVSNLKYFHLQSFCHSWNLDELASIIKRIPYVEELSISIESNDDIRVMDGEKFFSIFSILSLKKFYYLLRFYDLWSSIDHTKIVSTWQQFKQEFVCIRSDDKTTLALYTLPVIFSYLILPSSLAKNKVFSKIYTSQVKHLILYNVSTYIGDIFPVINKCYQIRNLELRIGGKLIPVSSEEIHLCKLFNLTKVTALRKSTINMKCFQRLLEISPNLRLLEVNYELLRPLLDHESICLLLKYRITHLYILISLSTSYESIISSIPRLTSIFPFLKHFYFKLEKGYQSSELLILAVLKYLSQWSSIVSFGVADAIMIETILSKGIQQWVLENSNINQHNSFVVDYTHEIFRLWL